MVMNYTVILYLSLNNKYLTYAKETRDSFLIFKNIHVNSCFRYFKRDVRETMR